MKYLYKSPQQEYPYARLVEENRRRGKHEPEYELLDTGVFDEDRYFDVFVEYAKETPESILVRITVFNRGPEGATLHVLPTLWFRNTWTWKEGVPRPVLQKTPTGARNSVIFATHPELGDRFLYCNCPPGLLFPDND